MTAAKNDAADLPHVFAETEVPQSAFYTAPGGSRGVVYTAGAPMGKGLVCGICRKPRADRIHVEGEALADAEAPNWG
jgi:hypothetical protein